MNNIKNSPATAWPALLLLLALYMGQSLSAQVSAAKIVFERKTNLYKKFREHDVRSWIKEEDKTKIDYFELYVTDTFSLFKPVESDLRDQFAWATSNNTVYQDFKRNRRYVVKNFWGDELHLSDSLYKRKWKITESSRKIAGYACRKAVWKANDSTRIYAWFSYELQPSSGPESFNGLPGTILGLATEDGSVVYFAQKVELIASEASVFVIPKKKKVYTTPELKEQLAQQWGKEKWFSKLYAEHFTLW